MSNKGKMIIVVGPSGAGKSSFLDRVVEEDPTVLDMITTTTRAMRDGESEGNPYFFIDEATFRKRIEQDYFVEWAVVHGNLYGVPKAQIDEGLASGKSVIMDVDVQGARTLKEKYPEAHSIFVLPPDMDSLRQRLIKRDGNRHGDLEVRLENATKEMALAGQFDYQLINDDFDTSYSEFKKIIEEIKASG